MGAFDDVRLPQYIEQGSTGGPQFFTSVLRLASGGEARNANWSDAKCVYDISYGVTNGADEGSYNDVIAFFRARRGRLRAFRFKDWSDFEGVAQPAASVGTDHKTFQLQKTYSDGVFTFIRPITRPVPDTVIVYVDGVVASASHTVDHTTGKITFTAAQTGAVTADFEFDVPVRFDSDTLGLTMYQSTASEVNSITLTEVPE